jgi:transketolase
MTPLDDDTRAALEARAHAVRQHIIRMAGGGGCFIGASLSCADLLVHLYSRVLEVSPSRTRDPSRDYLFLSKGHDVPALYGVLAELGYIERERLAQHLSPHDHLYWHPNRAIPGVEMHSGSLGHLLSVAMGVAYDQGLTRTSGRSFVVLGDGELDEGSIWEGLLVAGAKQLERLVVIIDRNGFQANVRTEALIPLEPLVPKLEAFGWVVRRIDGHDFDALEEAFTDLPRAPTAIIADTVRGRGLPSIEARADRWFVRLGDTEVQDLLAELEGGRTTVLSSPIEMPR